MTSFTLGSFDGVHLGHLSLLNYLKKKSLPLVVLTFTNHPLQILKKTAVPLITTLEHKLLLLEKAGATLLTVPFTSELLETPYDVFIKNIRKEVLFTHFALGKEGAFGKNREGKEPQIKKLGEQLGFTAEYLEKYTLNNKPISSGIIRECIREGKIAEASSLLGRPYSLYVPWEREISLQGLILPPTGEYLVKLLCRGKKRTALARLSLDSITVDIQREFPSLQEKVEIVF